MMNRSKLGSALALVAVVSPFTFASAEAQEDTRWTPWLGCWQPELIEDSEVEEFLCVDYATTPGVVEFSTFIDGDRVSVDRFQADGSRTDVRFEGCEGWQSSRFSADLHRVYVTAEEGCEGGVRRRSSGILALVSETEWVEVQGVEVDDSESLWVRRYHPAARSETETLGYGAVVEGRRRAVDTGRRVASSPPSVDAVLDANAYLSDDVLKTWVIEQGQPFDLDAEILVEFADAGVDSEVIDVIVAISYPERFAIAEGDPDQIFTRSDRYYEERYRPYYGSRGYFGVTSYYYSPYGYYGGYIPVTRRYYRSPVVIVPVDPSPRGRVIQGRGYTRGGQGSTSGASGDRSAPPTRGSSPPTRTAKPRGGSSGGGSARTSEVRSTRTAKPRGGDVTPSRS